MHLRYSGLLKGITLMQDDTLKNLHKNLFIVTKKGLKWFNSSVKKFIFIYNEI